MMLADNFSAVNQGNYAMKRKTKCEATRGEELGNKGRGHFKKILNDIIHIDSFFCK